MTVNIPYAGISSLETAQPNELTDAMWNAVFTPNLPIGKRKLDIFLSSDSNNSSITPGR